MNPNKNLHTQITDEKNILPWLESFATNLKQTSIHVLYLVSKPVCITSLYWYIFCINSEICKDILEHEEMDVNCGGIVLLLKNIYSDFAT